MKLYKQKASGYTEEVQEGFNFWAFLFGSLWYLFKGMIGKAILSLVLLLAVFFIFGYLGVFIGWIIIGSFANRQYEDHLIKKGYHVIKPSPKK